MYDKIEWNCVIIQTTPVSKSRISVETSMFLSPSSAWLPYLLDVTSWWHIRREAIKAHACSHTGGVYIINTEVHLTPGNSNPLHLEPPANLKWMSFFPWGDFLYDFTLTITRPFFDFPWRFELSEVNCVPQENANYIIFRVICKM